MNAPEQITEIKALLTGVVVLLTALWGWLGWAIIVMLCCMFLDWVTGSLAARARGEWSSAVAREGLWHKLGEIVALLVASFCDLGITVVLNSTAAPFFPNLSYENFVTLIVAIWYIFTELGSITENAIKLGAPVPAWLKKGIAILHKTADNAVPIGGEDPTE